MYQRLKLFSMLISVLEALVIRLVPVLVIAVVLGCNFWVVVLGLMPVGFLVIRPCPVQPLRLEPNVTIRLRFARTMEQRATTAIRATRQAPIIAAPKFRGALELPR